MKLQRTVVLITSLLLAVGLVGCKKSSDAAAEAAAEYLANEAAKTNAAAGGPTNSAVVTPAVENQPAAPTEATTGLVRYNSRASGNKAVVTGGTSMPGSHDWTMESRIIGGSMEVDPEFPASALSNPAAAKPVTSVYVPIRTLKSGKAAMDDKMLSAMAASKHPRIEYRLIELKPKSQPGATGPLSFDAVGALTIAGKTITNTMPVTIEKTDGKLHVIGSTPLKLTEFDVTPPTFSIAGIDAVSVNDALKVDFDWVLEPKKE